MTMSEQLVVGFNPMPATNKVAYCSRQIRSRLIWLLVSIVICFWIWLWQRQSLDAAQTAWLFGIGIAYSLIWLGIAYLNWRRAKAALAQIAPGVAMTVSRAGIWLQGTGMAWPEIARVGIKRGRFGGSPALEVQHNQGAVASVSLAVLDTMPGSIDAAVRSYSAGTQKIDTSKLGH